MMDKVLQMVRLERMRQELLYPDVNDTLLDGTGPIIQWLQPWTTESAEGIEQLLRLDYERHEAANGNPTWMHLVREEIAEAFQEDDPTKLATELVQVAALCVSWVERIYSREEASDAKGN